MIPGRYTRPFDYLRLLQRRRDLIGGCFLLSLCLAAAAALLIPARYKSETLILVVPQRVPESYVRSTITAGVEERLQTITQQIMSRTRLERVIQEFNLYPERRRVAGMDDSIARMRKDIGIELARNRSGRKDEDTSFAVSFVADDPDTAMRVTERLASLYIDENLRDREVLADGTNQFLESQLEEARSRLVTHEKRLEMYRRQHEGELPSQLPANLQVVQNTQMQLQALTDSLSRDSDRRLVLERLLADQTATALGAVVDGSDATALPSVVADPDRSATLQQLEEARRDLQQAQSRQLTAEHPDVVQAQRRIARIERQLTAPRPAAGPVVPTNADIVKQNRITEMRAELDNLNRSMAAKEEQQQRLRDTVAQYNARIEAVPTRESELVALTRDYQTLQTMYTSLLAKREESKVSAELERRQIGEQFRVLDPANRPLKPSSPNRLMIFGSSFLGLLVGAAIAWWLEFQDLTLRSDAEVVHALGLPVLGVFPMVATTPIDLRRRRVLLSVAAVAGLLSMAAIFIGLSR